MKERTLKGFGARLAEIRQSRGMTQADLGQAVGVSNRVIAYYEQDGAQPPGAMLVELAKALRVSSDQLLGLKTVREAVSAKTARLLKRLQRIESLPLADQRAVLKILDGLLQAHVIRTKANGRSRHRTRLSSTSESHSLA